MVFLGFNLFKDMSFYLPKEFKAQWILKNNVTEQPFNPASFHCVCTDLLWI